MDRYRRYKCEDFASDMDFIRWVQQPDSESDTFWSAFMQMYPELEDEIYNARNIVQSLTLEKLELPEADVHILWDKIDMDTRKPDRKKLLITILTSAACIALLFGLWNLHNNRTDSLLDQSVLSGYIPFSDSIPDTDVQVILADNSRHNISGNNVDLQYDEEGRLVVNKKNEIRQEISSGVKKTIFNQVVVPWGKNSSIVFSDGTKLWLNAGSKAIYPVEFANDSREVMIEGEAYFEVAHDAGRPFKVKTGDILVTVLGTRFNVNAYPEETAAAVTLVSGSVEVGTNGKKTILQQDQMLSVDKLTLQHTVQIVDVYDVICWKDGLMQFHSENVKRILQRIERHYAIRFIIDQSAEKTVKESFVSGKLDMKEDVEDVLKTIENLVPVKYKRTNNQVLIRKI